MCLPAQPEKATCPCLAARGRFWSSTLAQRQMGSNGKMPCAYLITHASHAHLIEHGGHVHLIKNESYAHLITHGSHAHLIEHGGHAHLIKNESYAHLIKHESHVPLICADIRRGDAERGPQARTQCLHR